MDLKGAQRVFDESWRSAVWRGVWCPQSEVRLKQWGMQQRLILAKRMKTCAYVQDVIESVGVGFVADVDVAWWIGCINQVEPSGS